MSLIVELIKDEQEYITAKVETEVLQFASCSTVFSADGKMTEYEFGRPVVRR